MPALFLLFLLIPLFEIWFLIKVGGIVGAGWTIFLVVATAVIGAGLVRTQGLSAIGRIQRELAEGGLPADELLQGVFLLVAGALLLTPGFFTDAIGFSLLVPPVRRWLARRLFLGGGRFAFQVNRPPGDPAQKKRPLEGEYRRED
jgi:UPF0716 protein FxsA